MLWPTKMIGHILEGSCASNCDTSRRRASAETCWCWYESREDFCSP